MKILIINIQNSGSRVGYAGLFLPFGVAYITSVLKECDGVDIECIDLHNEQILHPELFDAWDVLNKRFQIKDFDVIMFGGVFLKLDVLTNLSKTIRLYHKNIFQIAGGNLCTTIPDIILNKSSVDCVVLFEGEETVIDLIKAIKNQESLSNVKGIKFIHDKHIVFTGLRDKIDNLDKIPFPERDQFKFSTLRKAFPMGTPGRYSAIMFASRGCPFQCIFCNPVSGRKIRTRSPENIIEEIKYLQNKYNVQYFRFFDEVFIGSKKKIKDFCSLIKKNGIKIFWWCQTQINLVDEDLLFHMKDSGCIEIGYGIESGSDKILSEMKKGITSHDARRVIDLTYKIGIIPSISIICGTMSEDIDTLNETKEFLKSLNHIPWISVPQINFIIPLPGTEIFEIAKEKNIIHDQDKYIMDILSRSDRYNMSTNLTKMDSDFFVNLVAKFNKEIIDDYYGKHPFKKYLSYLGLNHIRLDLIFKIFNLYQIKPLLEALLWSVIGKRNNLLGSILSKLLLYR